MDQQTKIDKEETNIKNYSISCGIARVFIKLTNGKVRTIELRLRNPRDPSRWTMVAEIAKERINDTPFKMRRRIKHFRDHLQEIINVCHATINIIDNELEAHLWKTEEI